MPTANSVVGGVNPDLQRERDKCSFDVEEFAQWWHGGAKELRAKRDRENFVLDDPTMDDETPTDYLSHKEKYEVYVRKGTHVLGKMRELMARDAPANLREGYLDVMYTYMATFSGMMGGGSMTEGSPMGTHFGMFVPTIVGQGTYEQQEKWMYKAWKLEIIGTYAQTELGHGTFIRGMQTTATFDVEKQEFVLHSPSIDAYKWWPGGLGHTCSHAVVIAQVFSLGKHHGLHSFMVPLRDADTWHPLPGIIVGEIGPKLGLNGVNNGYLGFNNVRLPRDAMLMANARINEDGSFVESPTSVLTYGTMVFVRTSLARDMTTFLSRAAVIATRYSAVRRQSPLDPALPEPQVIDHVTQQNKLFPNIARAIAFKLVSERIWNLYHEVNAEMKAGDMRRLPELHALSCCIKAITTIDASFGIETLRMACGGHGFMTCSNLPANYGAAMAAATYDGEAVVMLLQTARFLVKTWGLAINKPNAKLPQSVAYFRTILDKNVAPAKWDPSLSGIVYSLKIVAARKIQKAYNNLEKRIQSGLIREVAVNETSIELAQAADAHGRAFLVESALYLTRGLNKSVSAALSTVVEQLVELYAIETCNRSMADLLLYAGLTEPDIQEMQVRLENLLHKLRPNAVGIVDGFDIPDKVLNSALGAYDGHVYERIFAHALKSPLNKEPVNASFHKYLKPFLRPKAKSHL